MHIRIVLLITLITTLLGGAALTGCGSGEDGAPATTVVERVTVQADPPAPETTARAATGTTDRAGSADADEPATSSDAPSRSKAKSSSSDCTEVPDVVGMKDLQLSQDALQAAGFYVMDQEDATGQGRSQLLDRNWVVTRQDPKAGECVSLDTTITTFAKKHGE